MKKIVSVIVLLLSFCSATLAQSASFTVSGTVKDRDGLAVPGAVIMLKDSQKTATVTNSDGNWSLAVPRTKSDGILSVSCLGYASQDVEIGGRARIDIVLEDDSEILEDAVVVGYGSMRRSDLTGSVTSVKIEEEEAAKSTSIDQLLMGRAAGVEVMPSSESPDAGVSIRIRGITSLNGSSEPLYVVDGIILTEPSTGSTISSDADEDVNSLMGLNPQDIASIEILKDASATAIYGAAGANGVVLITTKQADKDRPVIQFNAGYDISVPYKFIDVLDFEGFYSFMTDRNEIGDTNYGGGQMRRMKDSSGEIKVVPKNWQKEYLTASPRRRLYLSVSGRPNDLSYTLSFGANQADGIVPNTGSDQYTVRLNADKTLFKDLKIGTKVNFAYINSRQMQGAGSDANGVSSSFIKSLVTYRPYISMSKSKTYDDDDELEEHEDATMTTSGSPTKWIRDSYQTRVQYRVTPSLYLQYKIAKWVTFKSSFGADYHLQERVKFKGATVNRGNALGGVSYGERYNWNWDNTFSFNRTVKKYHKFSGTLGATMSRNHSNTQTVASELIPQYGIGVDNINSATTQTSLDFGEVQESKASVFGRMIYNYRDRYVLTATCRLDGSSRFAPENRFAVFPSAALAWRVSKEPWFNIDAISMLKLRLGWGQVGNCSVSPYQTMNTYYYSKLGYHFNEAEYITTLVGSNSLPNHDLQWEATEQYNLGLDFGMWDGRLTITADAYYKFTDNLLQSRTLPYSSGFTTMWVNQGSIVNKGLEISVDTVPLSIGDWELGISGNISFNRNKLTDIGYDVEQQSFWFEEGKETKRFFYTGASLGSNQHLGGAPANIYMEGQPIGLFYGYKTKGMVKEGQYGVPNSQANYDLGIYQQPGQVNYVDMNGNGYIDVEDRTIIGDSNPDFTYGFSLYLNWKSLRLSANFQGMYGREIFNGNIAALMDTHWQATPNNVLADAYYKAWTIVNPSDRYNAILDANSYGLRWTDVFDASNEMKYATDRYVEDGSYLRLSSLGLSYSFNLPKNWPVRKIAAGASVNNLWTWTKYSGLSPLVNSYKITSKRIGIDNGGYPSSRTFCFDLKFTF